MKILIIGSSGAGKSTLARQLGALTGIEVVHLDVLHWLPNWTVPPKDAWRARLAEALKGEAWIMDGNFGSTLEMRLEACETAILLDLPRALCVYRIVKRWLTYRKETRPDMAPGCDEKVDWEFVRWVWSFPQKELPKVEARLGRVREEKTIVRLRSRREIREFLERVRTRGLEASCQEMRAGK